MRSLVNKVLFGAGTIAALSFGLPKESDAQSSVHLEFGNGTWSGAMHFSETSEYFKIHDQKYDKDRCAYRGYISNKNGHLYIENINCFNRTQQRRNNSSVGNNRPGQNNSGWTAEDAEHVAETVHGLIKLFSKDNPSSKQRKTYRPPEKDERNYVEKGPEEIEFWDEDSEGKKEESFWGNEQPEKSSENNDKPFYDLWNEEHDEESKDFLGKIDYNKQWQYELGKQSRSFIYWSLNKVPGFDEIKGLRRNEEGRYTNPSVDKWYNNNLRKANKKFGEGPVLMEAVFGDESGWSKEAKDFQEETGDYNEFSKVIMYKVEENRDNGSSNGGYWD